MFTTKKPSLFEVPTKITVDRLAEKMMTNKFIEAGLNAHRRKEAETLSGNGALKYATTGNPFVDQFGILGSYKKPRTFSDISHDCDVLWNEDKRHAVLFIFYIRMISRTIKFWDGSSTKSPQIGAELKHEGIMRMIWLHMKEPHIFWNNIMLFVSAGSWKDVFTMLSYDLMYNGWEDRKLNWDRFGDLILTGLSNENTSELIKKYLPQIKTKSACKTVESQADTIIGKWICSRLFDVKEKSEGYSYKQYRKLKSAGTAHDWQKYISRKQFDRIDFNSIHGRALNLLVRSKFLANQGLAEKYSEWIKKDETTAKYTGFVHELFNNLPLNLRALDSNSFETINKQFDTLVQKAKSNEKNTSLIVVRDTSGSMGDIALGTKMSCYNIAKALALYFSEFLNGKFANSWIEFNSNAKMHVWKGDTPLNKWYNDKSGYIGGTDFLSVIKLFCQIKNDGVLEEDFPTGILCISDSEFNPSSLGITNVQHALKLLEAAGFSKEYISKFVIVLWNLQSGFYGPNTGKKFETYGNVENVFYFSGYSAATVSFLTGEIKNAFELFESAMDQEILNMIQF